MENIKKFLAKVEQDQELQAKFAQLRDPEEAYRLATSVQEGFTKEEFATEMMRLYEEATRDLSEEDIAMVAGGQKLKAENVTAALSLAAGGIAVVASSA